MGQRRPITREKLSEVDGRADAVACLRTGLSQKLEKEGDKQLTESEIMDMAFFTIRSFLALLLG